MSSMSDAHFVAMTQELDPLIVRFEALAQGARAPAFYWEEPNSGLMLAGFGRAWEHVSGPGRDRIATASAAAKGLFSRIDHVGDPAAGPKLVGGFSFSAQTEPTPPDGFNRWDDFPAGSLLLPRLTFVRHANKAWVTAVASAHPEARATLHRAVQAAVGRLALSSAESRIRTTVGPDSPDPNDEEAFRGLVKRAVAEVESGRLAKVVAARSAHVSWAAAPWNVLDVLRRRYPTCATYGVFRGDSVFLGASPELLVDLRDGIVTSTALAGTVERGGDELADARLEERLRHDPKELAEHQYVVQGLRKALHEAGVEIDAQRALEIVKLANVQHLAAPVTGRAPAGSGILDLVDAVHPTPAVAGLPRSAALDWLAANERLDRGWYAGPVGFVDSSLEGSFRAALRCALLRGDRARVFAGAGIVAGSQPERELAETTVKLRAMLDALGAR